MFLAETLYAIDKSSTSECKFSDLPLLALKFTKFHMSFLEPRAKFSSNFAPLFSVMRHNSSVIFHLNLCMLWKKGSDQIENFQTFDCLHEINQIPYVIFQATSQFSFKFCNTLQCYDTKFLWNFIAETHITCFKQKESIVVQFSKLLGAQMKVHCSVSWKITPLYLF